MSHDAYLEEINFATDRRNCAADAIPILYLEDGTEFPLPTTWGVCDVCDGKGSHVNPSIDASGLSAEDFANDPEFAEDYAGGVYDTVCNKCRGRTTVRVVAVNRLSPEHRKAYERQVQDAADDGAMRLAELRAGA
jgi:hypothetical protein